MFGDVETGKGYVVADTQFAADRWLADRPIDPAIRDLLAPFNHVKIGSGYPDLVGVRILEDEFVAVDRLGTDPPLIAIEAKGHTGGGSVGVETGIVQAYDRLGEANVAFLAAPTGTVSQSARTLARELNVGVLSVEPGGSVRATVRPRIVGNRTTSETEAIRFQASAQGVADKSFGLNHPKNYLAYPLALYHPDPTERVLEERVVGAVESAKKGAEFLDLIAIGPSRVELTALGREVVRFAVDEHGSVDAALAGFGEWKRTRRRFVEEAPKWGRLARRVIFAYPATELLVTELQHMYEDGIDEPTLVELLTYLHELHPSFAIELFVRGTDDVRRRVLDEEGRLNHDELADGRIYHAPTVFQLKAILFHAGVLLERGSEPSNLDPTRDRWTLRNPV
ncbi:MAG: hypothetical protein ACOCY7_03695 [Halodesulfurarchaeum sp.]